MSLSNGTVNTITLVGHLGKDVEAKTYNDKTKYSFSLATSRNIKNNGNWEVVTDWHYVEIWNLSNNIAQYLKKGTKVAILGTLTYNTWKEDNNKQVVKAVISAEGINLVDKVDRQQSQTSAPAQNQPRANHNFTPNNQNAPAQNQPANTNYYDDFSTDF